MAQFPELTTERLLLREFHDSDAPAVFEIFSSEQVIRYLNSERMQLIEEAEEKIRVRQDGYRNQQAIRWAITFPGQASEVIGSAGFYIISRNWFSCEVGFELHPRYWRRGIMAEALTAVIDFAYSEGSFFQANRIQALTYLENRASVGLLEKLGFRQDGILREYGYWKDDFHDLRCFSMLRREWQACRLQTTGNG